MGGIDLNSHHDSGEARYLERLRSGDDVRGALDAAQSVVHDDRVINAATTMLAAEGLIDMKRLAAAAGMSRASLYRYYPDRHQVEAEIAGIGLTAMIDNAGRHSTAPDKLREAATYLMAHPAQSTALARLSSDASIEVLAMSAELLVGNRNAAPIIMGLAAMIASAHRHGGDTELDAIIEAAADCLAND